MQGYNAQAVCTEEQIVIAAEVTIASGDFGQLEPMVTATETELTAAGVTDAPEVVLADAGYWHSEQIERLTGRGTVVLIPPDAGKRKGARPGWDGGLYAFMRRVLATDRGGELYRRRNGMIEPVFAHTKFNRRIDRFQRRGRAAARSEWRLITATHNLLKLHTHTLAASRRLRAGRAALATASDHRTPTATARSHEPLREPKLDKDDFVGKFALEHFAQRDEKERLVGFTMEEDVLPAEGAQVVVEGLPVGRVTSARR